MDKEKLDELVGPYEVRPEVAEGRDERAAAMDLGAQLNRLQGRADDEFDRRLIELFVSGRINRSEFVRVVLEMARLETQARELI